MIFLKRFKTYTSFKSRPIGWSLGFSINSYEYGYSITNYADMCRITFTKHDITKTAIEINKSLKFVERLIIRYNDGRYIRVIDYDVTSDIYEVNIGNKNLQWTKNHKTNISISSVELKFYIQGLNVNQFLH
jgi:hypothetical protein